MAHANQLPCDGDGTCMVCKLKPPAEETLTCNTCATPWHVACLASGRPDTMADALTWECPDCSPDAAAVDAVPVVAVSGGSADLLAAIRAIESDASLSDQEKAKRRQELLGGVSGPSDAGTSGNDVTDIIDGRLKCSFCMQLPERPVTTPCGHNFCLKCFEKWVKQGKTTCANCRNEIPHKMRILPRINSALVIAIRMAKMPKSNYLDAPEKVYHFICNQDRPDAAYTTERAKKPGKANACSGRIFVTVPPDHFGPILAQNDPRHKGVLVGEFWEDRMECRQWGSHRPHVAGIAGQSTYGAQSVALSGGYEDDEDHGEWFLYTGSGGRDLSGNKRTNKEQSSDQKFEKLNEALRVSCIHGYPVRVVRSHKEKSSSYAPEKGVRYDGVYRIEKCWRKQGIQKKLVCRYLFVRCDNEPAPWTSDEHGDRPRPLPNIRELKVATDITERTDPPSWDFDEEKDCWMWKKPPPPSKQQLSKSEVISKEEARALKRRFEKSMKEKLLKEFSCQLCNKVMNMPITTPCAHNFCKGCLEDAFAGQTLMKQRNCEGRRTLRAQKNIMKCPSPYCNIDIADFLQNPQVNRELMGLIECLQKKNEEEEEEEEEESNEENNDAATEKLEAVAEDEEPSSEELQVEEMTEAEVVVAKEDEEPKKAESEVEAVEEVKKENDDVTTELKEKAKQQQKLRGDAISDRATKRTKIAAEA